MERRINDSRTRTINGVRISVLNDIRYALGADDADALNSLLTHYQNINFPVEFYQSDFSLVDRSDYSARVESIICMPLLCLAAKFGRANCLELLMNKGADVNQYSFQIQPYFIEDMDSDGEVEINSTEHTKKVVKLAPLHEICCGLKDEISHFPRCATLLLNHGANMEAKINKKPHGKTALELCLHDEKIERTSPRGSFFVPANPRTSTADEVKPLFLAHLNAMKETAFKLS